MEQELEDSIEQPVVSVSLMVWQFQGYDENGLCRPLNKRLTCVHKVLCSAEEIPCKGRHDFSLSDPTVVSLFFQCTAELAMK